MLFAWIFLACCALQRVDAGHLRSRNHSTAMLPLKTVFEDEKGITFQFVQDPRHPHSEGAVALKVAVPFPADLYGAGMVHPLYICPRETMMITRHREKHRITVTVPSYGSDSDFLYDVVRQRHKGKLILSSSRKAITLTERSTVVNCFSEREVTSTDLFTIPSERGWDRFFNVPDNKLAAKRGNTVHVFNSSDGTFLYELSAVPGISNQTWEACPECTEFIGWDREQSWFVHSEYSNANGMIEMHFVANETAFTFSVTIPSSAITFMGATKVFVLTRDQSAKIHVFNLSDGSLDRIIDAPTGASWQIAVSADETRIVLKYDQFAYGQLSDVVQSQFLVEIDSTSGTVLRVRPFVGEPSWLLSAGSNSWMVADYSGKVAQLNW